jgi:hypothetical protein
MEECFDFDEHQSLGAWPAQSRTIRRPALQHRPSGNVIKTNNWSLEAGQCVNVEAAG